jgi:hypothetical protein
VPHLLSTKKATWADPFKVNMPSWLGFSVYIDKLPETSVSDSELFNITSPKCLSRITATKDSSFQPEIDPDYLFVDIGL